MSTGDEVVNAQVCKTCIRGFDSRPVLQSLSIGISIVKLAAIPCKIDKKPARAGWKEKNGIDAEGAIANPVDRRRLCARVGAAESFERSDSERNPGPPSGDGDLVDGQFRLADQVGRPAVRY